MRQPREPGKETAASSAPLGDLRVVDFSRVLAGPFCTMLLGDFGADVIKVEDPARGDDTRHFGPPFLDGPAGALTESAYFLAFNRSKRSIGIDLSTPEGRALALELCERADVVVENFRPRVMTRWGLGPAELLRRKPALVYASISGFGHRSAASWVDRPAYDLMLQGLGGIPSLTGDPEGPPYKVGTSMADLVAGLCAVAGILLALRVRDRQGFGQHVDISLLDGQIAMLSYHAVGHLAGLVEPGRMGNQHPNIVPYETFRCVDGWANVACATDEQFARLCAVLDLAELGDDPELALNRGRVAQRERVRRAVAAAAARHGVAELLALLGDAEIPAGPVLTVGEALRLEPVIARDMVVRPEHPGLGPVAMPGNPIALERTAADASRAPPTLGQHGDEILVELLGKSPAELAALRRAGALR